MLVGIDSSNTLREENIEDTWGPSRISVVFCCQNQPGSGELWRLSTMFEDFYRLLSKKPFLGRYMYGERISAR